MNQQPTGLVNGPADARRAAVTLISAVHRNLHLYTPYVDPRLYNDAEVVNAIRAQLIEHSRARFSLIFPPAEDWRRICPHFLQLTERLSSAMELRVLPKDEPRERPEFGQGFMIADHLRLLLLADPRRLIGNYEQDSSGKSKELLNFFLEIWEKSQPDPELRQLRL